MVSAPDAQTLRETAARLDDLAVMFHEIDDFSAAERLYREALQTLTLIEINLDSEAKRRAHQIQATLSKNMSPDRFVAHRQGYEYETDFKGHDPVKMGPDCVSQTGAVSIVILHNMALSNLQRRQSKVAIRLLEMAKSIIPAKDVDLGFACAFACVSVIHILGRVYSKLGRHDKAMEMFNMAIVRGNRMHGGKCLIARVLNSVGHFMVARGEINDALTVFQAITKIHDQQIFKIITSSFQHLNRPNASARAA